MLKKHWLGRYAAIVFAASVWAGEQAPAYKPEATPVDAIKVLKNFRVERLYNVPKATQGSWVSMCLDAKNRLIVCDQHGGLFRVTPPALGGNPEETKVEAINVAVGEAQGLLWAFDSLYVNVNKTGKFDSGLYRLRDSDGDDQLDTVECLRKFSDRSGEHGPHAVVLSPDGKSLYVVNGNLTKMTDFNNSLVPQIWSEDHLLPRMPDGRGFMAGHLGPGGAIYRVDPDGKNWELFAVGFRNQYDAAFNQFGDLFTFDADMEWDVNTPWYRPTRVCLVASGAEFGWRNGTGKWPEHYPDTLPPVINVGPGSPTGIVFGYGAKFPAKYQQALFICDWSYGRIYAVHLTQEGSSYKAEKEEFITAAPLPLTDLVVNPADGAMYFAVGGRRVQSGLYRVTYTGNESTAPFKAEDKCAVERATRRSLESFHGRKDPKAVETAWPHLGDKDRFIRSAARTAIEFQPSSEWQEKALNETEPQSAITALIALSRVNSRDQFHRKPDDPQPDKVLLERILNSLGKIEWANLDVAQRAELLRAYQLAFTRFGQPDAAVTKKATERLDPLFPADTREINGMLCELLIYLEAPSAASKSLAILSVAPTQEEQIDIAKSLRMLKTGWTMEQRKQYMSWFLKAANFKGGNSFEGFVNNIRKEAVANLPAEALAELKPIIEAKPDAKSPLEAFASVLDGRGTVKEWTVEELAPLAEMGLKSGRSFDRGRQLFGAVGCFACHRFDNDGGSVGPDLTGTSGRFSPRDLLESIITPSKEVSDQYQQVVIATIEGQVVTGRIVNLANDSYRVSTKMLEPNELTILKIDQVKSIKPSKLSPMPEGLINRLKEDEILDLLAYLLSKGDKNHTMFAK